MKNFTRLLIRVVMGGVVLCFVSTVTMVGIASAGSTLERVKEQGYIRVAFANEAPYAYATTAGKLTGEAPEIARAIFKKMGIDQLDGVLTEWASLIPGLRAGRFDVITCMEMLEHVPDPTSIIAACAKALKPEGIAFFSTLNRNPRAFIEAIVGAEYLLKMLPTGTHHYDKFIRPDELIRWCRHSDLEPIATKGLIYSPISKRYRLASKLHTNYLLACQRAS